MATSSTKMLYAEKPAIEMLLHEVHPRRAFIEMVKGNAENFDAPIGDASCHARTPIVNAAATTFHAHLMKVGKHDDLMEAIAAYERKFSSIPRDGRIKKETDIKDHGHGPAEFEAFYTEYTGLLEPKTWELLVAFYSKTVDCTKSFMFNGASFARRDHAVYHASTEEAEASKIPRDREDLDAPLKAKIGSENVDYLVKHLNNIMKHTTSIEHELTEALTATRALVRLPNGTEYNVGQIYALFATIFYLEYQAGRPIVISVRRMVIDNGLSWEHGEVLFWAPNNAGSWTYVPNPTKEQRRQVCTYLNMWGTITPEIKGTSLHSRDLAEFMAALKTANLPWIVLRYAGVHPSYAGKADRKEFAGEADLIKNAETITQGCTFDDVHCDGFNFNPHLPGQDRLDLRTQWTCAYLAGIDIKNGREYADVPGQGDIRTYTKDAISLAVNHVQSGTFDAIQAEMERLWTKYDKAGRPELGHFIVRYGSQGVHFDTLDEAAKFAKLKSNQQKRFLADNGMATLYEK